MARGGPRAVWPRRPAAQTDEARTASHGRRAVQHRDLLRRGVRAGTVAMFPDRALARDSRTAVQTNASSHGATARGSGRRAGRHPPRYVGGACNRPPWRPGPPQGGGGESMAITMTSRRSGARRPWDVEKPFDYRIGRAFATTTSRPCPGHTPPRSPPRRRRGGDRAVVAEHRGRRARAVPAAGWWGSRGCTTTSTGRATWWCARRWGDHGWRWSATPTTPGHPDASSWALVGTRRRRLAISGRRPTR